MDYKTFLENKKHINNKFGIEPLYYNKNMFDYQNYIAEFSIRKGRNAIFLDTGLGKTLIELLIAKNFVISTNKPVLIITPLAVAFQFIKEANKFGIEDVEYCKNGIFNKKIIITNYERLSYFNSKEFDCVILDESSILKNFDGHIKTQVTDFLKKVKYRYLATATPSPNDYIELGTSSEALGYMGYIDMLGRFFKNNQNNTVKLSRVSQVRQGAEYYLKPHAENDFWQWVSTWSISARKPSDLGFDDSKHILPNLYENIHIVKNNNNTIVDGNVCMFNIPAQNFFDIKKEVNQTLNERCEKAVDLAKDKLSVYWCNLNSESNLLSKLDKNATELLGSLSIDKKEDILLDFANGNIERLITKSSMTAFGLNWQHCNHTVYFPTFSYEKYYQSIRRFYRFGQLKDVNVDIVISDGQRTILDSLMVKKENAINMYENLVKYTNNINIFVDNKKEFNKNIIKPNFL